MSRAPIRQPVTLRAACETLVLAACSLGLLAGAGALLFSACGGASDKGQSFVDAGGDGATSADAAGCQVVLAIDPQQPIADPNAPIRAQARVFGSFGVPMFTWTVQAPDGNPVPTTVEATDGSMIDFIAATAGSYAVRVRVDSSSSCPDGFTVLAVAPPGAQVADYRVRVTPNAADGAPPQETIVQVLGGGDVTRTLALDPGLAVTGQVKNGSTGVPAYLRFMPVSSPNGYVEVFTDSTGHYSTRLLGQNHNVLVVPTVPGVAPAVLPWTVQTTTLDVSAGNAVTGTVKDSAGNPLAGAQIQLTHNGVPSSLATTAADGSYTVRTSLPASGQFDVRVWPPAGRGLSALNPFDIAGPTIAIQYSNNATCDLTGAPVMRGSTPEPGAHVTLVGIDALAAAVNGSQISGLARISVTADGTGKLPSTVVAGVAVLYAVVDLGGGDVAVTSVDTSSCAAQTINVPARTVVTGTVVDAASHPLPGARIEAVPNAGGSLGLAGMPSVEVTADSSGAFSLPLATGGHYDVTFSDPHAHNSPLTLTNVDASGVPTTALLGKAIKLSGDVSVIGNANPVIGASIQILPLNGGAAATPIAETASTATSTYAVGIPDPGTM